VLLLLLVVITGDITAHLVKPKKVTVNSIAASQPNEFRLIVQISVIDEMLIFLNESIKAFRIGYNKSTPNCLSKLA
jgi:Na+-transporting NADH:ubiquinone oxidoreductase subunit NqrD